MTIDNNNLAFSDAVYDPEALLSDWLIVSNVMVTTGLLFYHMTRTKSIKVSPTGAHYITLSLILLSVIYMMYALIPYAIRMNYVENECKTSTQCSPTTVKNMKYSYISVVVLTAIVQIAISYTVIKTV